MIKAPCKDCEKRYVGCHSSCEEYLAFKKDQREYNEKVLNARNKGRQVNTVLFKNAEKAMKRYGRQKKK